MRETLGTIGKFHGLHIGATRRRYDKDTIFTWGWVEIDGYDVSFQDDPWPCSKPARHEWVLSLAETATREPILAAWIAEHPKAQFELETVILNASAISQSKLLHLRPAVQAEVQDGIAKTKARDAITFQQNLDALPEPKRSEVNRLLSGSNHAHQRTQSPGEQCEHSQMQLN